MANRSVTNNPGNKGSQPSRQSTEREGTGTPVERQNPTSPVERPANDPIGNAPERDTEDDGKAEA